jgi:hypothetical protein
MIGRENQAVRWISRFALARAYGAERSEGHFSVRDPNRATEGAEMRRFAAAAAKETNA